MRAMAAMLLTTQVHGLESDVEEPMATSKAGCRADYQEEFWGTGMVHSLRGLVYIGLVAASVTYTAKAVRQMRNAAAAVEKERRLAAEAELVTLKDEMARQKSPPGLEKAKVKRKMSGPEQEEARKMWDKALASGEKKKAGKMPRPPADQWLRQAWDIEGENLLPADFEVPTFLAERTAGAIAWCIDRAPTVFVSWCEGLSMEYLVCIFEQLNWVSLQTMMTSGRFDEVGSISSNNQMEKWLSQDKHYRTIYAVTKHDDFLSASAAVAVGESGDSLVPPLVLNPHLGLVDVLDNQACFDYQAWDEEEQATPKLFDFSPTCPTGRAVVSKDDFLRQFDVFCMGQLAHLDWNNVVAAGGSVLAATRPPPPGPLVSFYNNISYRSSDVDLFLYGLDEGAATEKVKQIYAAIKHANPQVFAVRTQFTVTIVSEFPYRKIQIVLRLYKTLAEVLHGFDVDACSVGYDGQTVWATNRAARAICKRYNVVDISRRSPSYESRLFKYGKRGYALLVKGLRVENVNPALFNARAGQGGGDRANAKGLAKLLAMDSSYQRYLLGDWGHAHQRWKEGKLNGLDERLRVYPADPVKLLQRRPKEEEGKDVSFASDYTFMLISYGPTITARSARSNINCYITKANEGFLKSQCGNQPNDESYQPVLCGSIEEVLSNGAALTPEEKVKVKQNMYRGCRNAKASLAHMKHVVGDTLWLKVNPGKQDSLLTGSFQPMITSKDDWEEGAYR